MSRIDLKYATFHLTDGANHGLLIKLGDGNFQYTEKKERQYFKDRGKLDAVRDGDEQPVEVRFDAVWEFIAGVGDSNGTALPSIEDALKRRNASATWTSSDTDTCNPYALDLTLRYKPNCSSVNLEALLFPDFRYEELAHDAKNATIACSGKSNSTEAVASRAANTGT